MRPTQNACGRARARAQQLAAQRRRCGGPPFRWAAKDEAKQPSPAKQSPLRRNVHKQRRGGES
eukprot:5909177-Alexandrium_andersonii.AAC.1